MYEVLGEPRLAVRLKFRRAEPHDDPESWVSPKQLRQQGIAFAYVDAMEMDETAIINELGRQLGTEHPPYDPKVRGWLRLFDDLMTLSGQAAGLAIVIDRAGPLISGIPSGSSWAEDFIEWWAILTRHWIEKERPIQLVFQMDDVPAVRRIYGPLEGNVG
jgi:hypothetical protein